MKLSFSFPIENQNYVCGELKLSMHLMGKRKNDYANFLRYNNKLFHIITKLEVSNFKKAITEYHVDDFSCYFTHDRTVCWNNTTFSFSSNEINEKNNDKDLHHFYKQAVRRLF